MSVITISREFGSEGDAIAHRTAEFLGYHFVDQKFIGEILSQYGYVEFDKEYKTLPTFWERFDAQREKQRDLMVKMLNQVIEAVARHGDVVILGRSGFEVLGRFNDVLHVRIQAPFSQRIERVMLQKRITAGEADALVKNNDKLRKSFVEEFYGVPWSAIQAFDLVINTGKIPPELAVEWVIQAAKSITPSKEPGKISIASLQVDRILSDAVSDMFGCNQTHGQT